jgi:4-amino-4-deoxy-L-arabinose transferase-like glycosyltransferase
VTALMSCAPMQIAMSQRMFIDGVLTFWSVLALWTLWECLRQPEHAGWLAAYTISLTGMVLTKENAAFIYLGLLSILILNRWLRIGRISLKLIVCTLAGPAIGLGLLILVCGGVTTFIHTYQINVQKSVISPYAIRTGDGPWYRYLLDLVIMSPVVTMLAIAAAFRPDKENKVMLYLLVFVFASYALMGNVRYGMNLRYANIWDLPMRWLTYVQLAFLTTTYSKKRLQPLVLAAAVAVICVLELRQYLMFFADAGIYDPVTEPLLRVLKILK